MNKFEKTFAEAFRAGEVDCDHINDYIEYWHKHDTGNGLQEFLGMTKDEFVNWVKTDDYMLYAILGVEIKMPVCKICGIEMGVRTAGRIIMRSCYNGTDVCDDCQMEHCMSTNCLGCEIGNKLSSYTECEHLDRKKFYMEEERLEREEAVKKKVGDVDDGE